MAVDDALTRALALADAMQVSFAAKARSSPDPERILSGGPMGAFSESARLGLEWDEEAHWVGWVYAAVKPIMQRIAAQPVRVARKTKNPAKKINKLLAPQWVKDMREGLELVETHAIVDAIDRPNEVMVRAALLAVTVASMELTGRAFWWIVRDERGGRQLWPVPSSWMEPRHNTGFFSSYMMRPRIAGATLQVELPGEDVVRLYYPDVSDPYHGSKSPLQAAARAVLTDESIQNCQHNTFRAGIFPGMAVIVGRLPDAKESGLPPRRPVLDKAQRSQIITAIRQAWGGTKNAGHPIILDGLIEDIKRISNLPAEMDFLNSGAQTKARIFQAFGTNPIIAGEIENANRAQAAIADELFCSNTVNPKVELISQWLTRELPPRFDDPDVVVWLEECRPRDPEQTRAEMDQLAKYGCVTKNELRAVYSFPPLEQGGDELIQVKPAAPARPGGGEGGGDNRRSFQGGRGVRRVVA
jgi:HK97 family phage portal protein